MTEFVANATVLDRSLALGVSPGMLQRYTAAGLIAPSTRHGHGLRQGATFTRPPLALTQVAALGEARRVTRDLRRLRHWLWWEDLLPDGWAQWRADRLVELGGLAAAGAAVRGMTLAQRERAEPGLAAFWGQAHRVIVDPFRGRRLPDDTTREQAAAAALDSFATGRMRSDADGRFDLLAEARRRGLPASVGVERAELALRLLPAPEACAGLFALLTEPDARRLRDGVRGRAGTPYDLTPAPLRETPELAALMLVVEGLMAVARQRGVL